MIAVTGINHITAPLEIRERFVFSQSDIAEFSSYLQSKVDITELVILSTCNRTEFYYYLESKDSINNLIVSQAHKFKKITEDYSDRFYYYINNEAINHLFSVTSGMDSKIFGEDQIVRQVKESYLTCTNLALTDAILMRLFQKSFEVSKRVRTQTNIQNGTTSVSYIAAEKCQDEFVNLEEKTVLIIGTGETGKLSLLNFAKKGVKDFYIANRTLEKAIKIAEEYKANAINFSHYKEILSKCDIIITVTNSNEYLITKEDILSSINSRKGKKQIYIDLSVPRNIDSKADTIENIKVFTIDSLQEKADNNSAKRLESKKLAKEIINEMVEEYNFWLKNRKLRPLINNITNNIQNVHKEELENYKQCYSPEVINAIDEYAGKITQKYIRTFIRNLKEINANGNTDAALKAIEEIFTFDKDK